MKITPVDMSATWTVIAEQAGCPSLVGSTVHIEIQQVNPMLRRAVITPLNGRVSDESNGGIFTRIKPSVVSIQGDIILCSLGIVAKKNS
jgi:hypothetical protein